MPVFKQKISKFPNLCWESTTSSWRDRTNRFFVIIDILSSSVSSVFRLQMPRPQLQPASTTGGSVAPDRRCVPPPQRKSCWWCVRSVSMVTELLQTPWQESVDSWPLPISGGCMKASHLEAQHGAAIEEDSSYLSATISSYCFSIIIKNMVMLMFSSSILIRLLFIIVLYSILLLLVHTTILALATCFPILYDHQRLASQWSEKIGNFDGCCFSKTSNCYMRAIDFWYKV